MAIKFCFLFFATLYICTTRQNVLASLQQITFYQDLGCSGRNETFTDTRDDLDTTWTTNATSVLIVGVWKIHVSKSISNTSTDGITFINPDAKPPLGKCLNKTEVPNVDENYKFIHMERLGPSDMTSSQIIFCTEDFFTGLRYVADKDYVEQLPPRPFVMESAFHFSNDTWTSFSNANFEGDSIQFLPSSSVGEDGQEVVPVDNFSFNISISGVVVGSVEKASASNGCSPGSSAAAVMLLLMFTSIIHG